MPATTPNSTRRPLPVALTIAGSDNSAGAGIQADLKTFSSLGIYGLTAVTCVVAEVPGNVSVIHPVPASVVTEQIRLCLNAFPVTAVKTGMLFSKEIIEAIAATLAEWNIRQNRAIHVVIDPVMVATSGHSLLLPDAIAAAIQQLFPLATIVTPNLDEAERLLGSPISGVEALTDAAIALAARYNTAFLVKGGHLVGEETTDVMATPSGTTHCFRGKRVTGVNTHGTGCTLSAAITAGLAAGVSLPNAIDSAVTYVQRTIATHHRWMKINGEPIDALNHFPRPLDNQNG